MIHQWNCLLKPILFLHWKHRVNWGHYSQPLSANRLRDSQSVRLDLSGNLSLFSDLRSECIELDFKEISYLVCFSFQKYSLNDHHSSFIKKITTPWRSLSSTIKINNLISTWRDHFHAELIFLCYIQQGSWYSSCEVMDWSIGKWHPITPLLSEILSIQSVVSNDRYNKISQVKLLIIRS